MEKAEKFLKSVSSYSTNDRFDDCEYTWDSVIDWLNDYASQQCAELQKELEEERKSNHLLHQAMTSAELRGVEKGKQEQQSENESLKKRVSELTDALFYARQMLVGYSTRHPDERQIMLSSSNNDVFLLIEKALNPLS